MKNFLLMMFAFAILLIAFESPAQEPESPDRLALFWNESDASTPIQTVDQLPDFDIENIQLVQSGSFEYVLIPESNFNSFESVPGFDIENVRSCTKADIV